MPPHSLCAHMHVPLLLHTSNTPSPVALLFLASLLVAVPTPHPLVAASSPHHPNGRLVLHYTTPVWQNVAGSMHTTNNGTALTTLSRTPATSVELTCQNRRCGYAIKYSMAMATPYAGDSTVGALQHELLRFYFPRLRKAKLILACGPIFIFTHLLTTSSLLCRHQGERLPPSPRG